MNFKKMVKKLFSLAVVAVAAISVASCNKDKEKDLTYTYNTYTSTSPSNWNELTYQDANDTQIMSYISSSFFTFDFKFDANGEIVPGQYEVEYSAATKLEDVTKDYAGADKGWGIPADATGRAYKITLREDLKWDDGTAIDASDFVYTMKEQLDPLAKHYRADSFYVGGTIIHNAKGYALQNSTVPTNSRDKYTTWAEAKADSSIYFTLESYSAVGKWLYTNYGSYIDGGKTPAWVVAALGCAATEAEMVSLEGKTWSEISADATLSTIWEKTLAFWKTMDDEELDFFVYDYTYPTLGWENVGIFVGDTKYELVVVLDKALDLLNEDGSLDYKAAYNFSSLPLVHREKWEENKVAPTTGSELWTSTYNTSVSSTASWGPYSLVSFQSGKQYKLERNANWYGYNMEEYEGQYQTDRIVCETVGEWNTAWLMFLAGEVDAVSIDVSIASEYKGSERAYFTPDDYVDSMQLQSSKAGLEARETENVNKTMLTYKDFRKALSLAIDRVAYTTQCTTSYKAGFGLFNSMHYYDVANGGVFRDTIEAKKVLCDVYAVEYDENSEASIEAAYNSITGYDLETAKQLLTAAYNQALEDGEIDADDKVVLTFGTSVRNATVERRVNFFKNAWQTLAVGTPLEGRIDLELEEFGNQWANDFRAGAYDVCLGGWTGAAWDPGYFLLAYLSPDYMYSKAWDTSAQEMTFTMKGVGEDGADITDTMSLLDWYDCLNGASGAKYDFSSNALEESQRLQLIAALEKEVLSVYYTVPVAYSFGASLMSYKTDYITYEYNTFVGYGGLRYMTYNYNNYEWEKLVEENGGELNYK